MTENNSPLENLHIAAPCHADWDKMTGDDKARFCQSCQKNVFNISMMTRQEAEALITQKEGNLCVQYAMREDGTIITNDCPVGLKKAQLAMARPWRFFVAGVAGIIAALCGAFGVTTSFAQPPTNSPASKTCVKGDAGFTPTVKVLRGEPAPLSTPMPKPLMGKPTTVVQGAPIIPKPVSHAIMGKIAAPQTKTPVKPQVKPIVKKAPAKKTAKR